MFYKKYQFGSSIFDRKFRFFGDSKFCETSNIPPIFVKNRRFRKITYDFALFNQKFEFSIENQNFAKKFWLKRRKY